MEDVTFSTLETSVTFVVQKKRLIFFLRIGKRRLVQLTRFKFVSMSCPRKMSVSCKRIGNKSINTAC